MIDQLRILASGLTTSQKIGVVFGAFASAILLIGFVTWAGRPDMQPAFSRLAAEDAAAISDALRTAKIQFTVTDGGSTIMVPTASLSDARVAAAAAGIVTDGSAAGFELFDQGGFGMTEFDQQVTYQRAMEGKLTQTIESMNGVESATVSVVAAQTGIVASEDSPATASVMIRMQGGVPPSAAMVRGIVSTVAGAIKGLSPDNVTVVDDSGRVLAGPDSVIGQDALSAKLAVEHTLTNKVQALVDQALGIGHASVAVSATLDMSRLEQQTTTVVPITESNWTPTSYQVSQETYGGPAGSGPGGIPGSLSNIPGLPTYPGTLPPAASPVPSGDPTTSPAPSASPGTSPATSPAPSESPAAAVGYVKTEQTVNYNNSQTIQHVTREPGMIEKVSVSVLLDEAVAGSLDTKGLQTAIEAAIGADLTRGDVVAVMAVPFAAPQVADASPIPPGVVSTASDVVGGVIGGLAGLGLLFLLWRNLRALRGRAEEMQLAVSSPAQGLLASYGSTGAAADLGGLGGETLEESPQAKIQERLRMVAEQKPDAIVNLMNSWLHEDQRR